MPVYCETALYGAGAFPAEPVNSVTSLVPVIAGLLALLWLWRRRERAGVPWLLAVLALWTGLGSIAWHALRTELALILDTAPGLLYFVIVVLAWPHLLGARFFGPALIALVVALAVLVPGSLVLRLALAIALLVLAASWLLWLTWRRRPAAFAAAAAMVAGGAAALVFRSADASLCQTVPFGSHFLWHVFLGLAAYAGVRMTARLAGAGGSRRPTAQAPRAG